MNKLETAADRTLTIEKTLDAPLKLVWNAWSQAEHLANWWGPKGMAMEVVEFDFKVGGKWKFSMPMPKGQTFISEGEYVEIVPMEKIVTTADFKPMTVGVEMHMIFEAKGDKTQFTFHVVHETTEYCKQQEEMGFYNGWSSAFERLAAHLA